MTESATHRTVWECGNPRCRALWLSDPRGRCPDCIGRPGGGWICTPRIARVPPERAPRAGDKR